MTDAARARVLAIVVATDGEATLPRTLAALAAQDHEALTVVGVDNGSSDRSRALLTEALGADHVLVAERDLGFGGAVGMALDAEVGRGPELVLLVHDDLELRPDAVSALVRTMLADDELAVVGCKLVEWDDPRRLQAVGLSVDVTGRADPGVEPDERDQGQHDHERRALYVSTAGMLLRRDRFEALHRFDHRYHVFRDDLDLCWRAWLAGWTVEIEPGAVAAHEASASTYKRLGQAATLGPRYFAERNTLATLLKNYSALRLLYVLPLFLGVGVAKVAGFAATRRVGDVWQTVRAWLWNLLHLRETLRLRARVQHARRRSDGELTPLFAQVSARLRAYAEALGGVLTGGSDAIGLEDPDAPAVPEPTFTERMRTTIRTSPIGVAAVLLLVLGAVASVPLLRTTPLVGGELAPWPSGATRLLSAYVWPQEVGDLPAVTSVNPAQLVLAIPALLTGGSVWATPRVLLLLVVPLAWGTSLRAGRLVSSRRLPRVVGATLYALSPPVLAALRTGRLGAAIAAALLPLLVIASARAVLPGTRPDRAWRAAAVSALLLATVTAFAPVTAVLVLAAGVVVAVGVVVSGGDGVPGRLTRLVVSTAGGTLLLLPWVPRLGSTAAGPTAPLDLGRLLLLSPDLPGFPPLVVGVGLVAAALLGVALSAVHRGPATAMVVVFLAAVAASWAVGRAGPESAIWVGGPLTVAALTAAGLLALGVHHAEEELSGYAFGWRQLAAAGAAVLVVVGVGGSALSISDTAWDDYRVEADPLPAFLASQVDADGIGPFRVLVLAEHDGVTRWAVTDADGPTLASYGHEIDPVVEDALTELVATVVAGAEPSAAAELGRLGIRYVVVPEDGVADALTEALDRQLDLVPAPVAEGVVHRVVTWMPRWAVLPTEAEGLLATGRPLPPEIVAVPLEDRVVGDGQLLVLADAHVPDEVGVEVTAGDTVITPRTVGSVTVWDLPAEAVTVTPVRDSTRLALLAVQAVLLLLVLSLSVRAPRFAREGR